MPDLPIITINNQTTFDRVVDAFPGETNAEKVKAYRVWHRRVLKEFVVKSETRRLVEDGRARIDAQQREIEDLLPEPGATP